LDVSLTPALMKKGRMGTIIKVIARKGEGDGLASLIVSEGGSLGVRMSRGMHRVVARRDVREIEVDVDGVLEKVRVKLALKPDGTLSGLKAEHEDVKSIAERRKLPLKKVGRVVEGKAWEVFR
ncbi:MAG: nickel pincer cofactor biosynthesis protein LarC2, partial [Methermicoccaceae archaeon]